MMTKTLDIEETKLYETSDSKEPYGWNFSEYDQGGSVTDNATKDEVGEYLKNKFEHFGFISGEKWDKTITIQARVSKFNADFVECVCLLDKEEIHFDNMSFARSLFENIEHLEKKPYIILKIMSKPGSTRIDIHNGDKIVDKKFFELEEKGDDLNSSDFGTPLDTKIRI